METVRWSMLFAAATFQLLAGCAATPQIGEVKEVRVCAAGQCAAAGGKYSGEQLLDGFRQLLKANAGEKVNICSSDLRGRACNSVGICQFVLGGILPGNGCSQSIAFSEVATGGANAPLRLKADMPLTFIGTTVSCEAMTGTASVGADQVISVDFEPHYCNWMLVGSMSATFSFAVESLDLDRGQVGVFWSHAVKGTGNGRGSGYALLEFPKHMPSGQNWVGGQPLAMQPAR